MPSVGELLNAAQDGGAAAHDRCAAALWRLCLADPDAAFDELAACVDRLLLASGGGVRSPPPVERAVRFFGAWAARTPADSEVASAVVEELLAHLAARLPASDKGARYRACQLLGLVLTRVPEALLVEDSVVCALRGALLERLQDKLPAVRAEAVRALCHLVPPGEEGEPATAAVAALLEGDRSKDVRVAAVQSLPATPASVPLLLRRARDVSPLVRRALLGRLRGGGSSGGVPLAALSIQQRAELLQGALADRDASVAAAACKLVAHWLTNDCGGDPLRLLQLLDVETHPDAAARAVEALVEAGAVRAAPAAPARGEAVEAVEGGGGGPSGGVAAYVDASLAGRAGALVSLRSLAAAGPRARLLRPHEALMWRCVCEWLRKDAASHGLAAAATGGARAAVRAAAAAERHEVLERALPAGADELLRLAMLHAEAGPPARFAAAQLLTIAATCVEWADAASRDAALPYLRRLLLLSPTADVERDDGDDDDDADGGHGGSGGGLPLAGNGGDGLFEEAVARLALAVQGGPTNGGAYTATMLDGVAALAEAAGLVVVQPQAAEEEQMEEEEEGGGGERARVVVVVAEEEGGAAAADAAGALQCLCYARLLLQRLPSGRPVRDGGAALRFAELWRLLLALALKQRHAAVRAAAVECVALYALAGARVPGLLTAAVQLLGPLLAAGGDARTREAAAKGLADIALLFGPAAVDSALCSGSAGDEGGDEGGEAASAAAGKKPLLELLLGQAEALLADAQAAAADAAPMRRGGRGKAAAAAAAKENAAGGLPAASAALLATVAEALAKLLLHQRAWLPRYAAASSLPLPLPADAAGAQVELLRRGLALLLLLQFHPATEAAPALRQCLSVFFDAFAAAAPEHRQQLVGASLPAARQALHLACKRNPAALLVKYALQLLQLAQQPGGGAAAAAGDDDGGDDDAAAPAAAETTTSGDDGGDAGCWAQLLQQLLAEAEGVAAVTVARGVQPAKYKPYLSALLRLALALPLASGAADGGGFAPGVAVARLLVERLAEATARDAALRKDVAAVAARLESLATIGDNEGLQEQLPAEQLDALVEQLQAVSLEQLAPLPLAATGAARRGGGRAAAAVAGRPRRGRAAAVSEDDDETSDESSSSSSDDDADSFASADEEDSSGALPQEEAQRPAAASRGVKAGAAAAAPPQPRAARAPLGESTLVNAL